MVKRVTAEDEKIINEVYYVCKNYAETARQTGWSVGTVRSHVKANYVPAEKENIKKFDMTEMPAFSTAMFVGVDNYGTLCVLSNEEKDEIKELWKKMSI